MTAALSTIPFDHAGSETLAARLRTAPHPGTRLFWLGQAGFVIETAGRRLVIDPYLSDSLAEKYRGEPFSHERLMPPPVQPNALGAVDLVLGTHHHTDHMDAQTLQPLLRASPQSRFVAPAASITAALERGGIEPDRLLPMDAGETIEPFDDLRITATPAAHEARERDENGRHRFLGYLIESGDIRIWHSGDCVPFANLVEAVAPLKPTIALLPVNGRKEELSAQGIAGNFSIGEAVELAQAVGAQAMIAHHYDMFAFNTADPEAIDRAIEAAPLAVVRARLATCYACG